MTVTNIIIVISGLIVGIIIRFIIDSVKIKKVKKNCTTCKFNDGMSCNVGTYYADQGKTGKCYEGELWELNNQKNTHHEN